MTVASVCIDDEGSHIDKPVVTVNGNSTLTNEINNRIDNYLEEALDGDHLIIFSGSYTVYKNSDGLLSLCLSLYLDGGGAHGYCEHLVINYSVRTGENLVFSDLFDSEYDYEPMFAEHAEVYCNGEWDPEDITETLDSKYDYEHISNNFCISNDSIIVTFPQGIVSCWAAMPIYFEIPLADLEGNLNSAYF